MIEVGEYVKTIDGRIGIFDRYSSRKEDSIYKSPFNCFIKLQGRKTPLQCDRDYIKKHSKNIINLIEVGDIVHTRDVLNEDIVYIWSEEYLKALKEDLDNGIELVEILTHEQYEENCYTVERKEEWNIDI